MISLQKITKNAFWQFFEKELEMQSNLKEIIQYITSTKHKYPFGKKFHTLLTKANLQIDHAKKNDLLIKNEMPSKYVYILLDGYCCSEKYSPDGKLLTSSAISAIEIFGLYEVAHPALEHHTATIRCISPCAYIRIPKQLYIEEALSDAEFAWISAQHLSLLTERILAENEPLLLNNTKDKLLLQLYQYSINQTHFPIRIKLKKEELANILNISLRTLYRQLDLLYQEGILSSYHGKIMITEEQFHNIRTHLDELF